MSHDCISIGAENNFFWVNLILCEFTGVSRYCIVKRGSNGWMRNETACMSSPLIDSASFPRWGQSHTSWCVKMDLIHMNRRLNASVILFVCVCVCFSHRGGQQSHCAVSGGKSERGGEPGLDAPDHHQPAGFLRTGLCVKCAADETITRSIYK